MSKNKNKSGRLVGSTTRVVNLDGKTRAAMWHLFQQYYDSVSEKRFDADLDDKTAVTLLRDSGDDSLQGFSTLVTWDRIVEKRSVRVVFSGDTIINEDYWGQTALQREFLKYIMGEALRRPLTPTYWYLLTKGYKTYLLLSRNFPEHWPRHESPTPSWQQALIAQVASEHWPQQWRQERGILEFKDCVGKLGTEVAPIRQDMLKRPDLRFFLEQNSGHAQGDELCCVGRVNLRLWSSYMSRLAKKAMAPLTVRRFSRSVAKSTRSA